MDITLINDGRMKKYCPTGFSWTTLFFGFLVPLFRGDLIGMVIHILVSLVSIGVAWFVWPFLYNKNYINRLLEKGFMPYSELDIIRLRDIGISVSISYESQQKKAEEKDQQPILMNTPAVRKTVEPAIKTRAVADFDYSNLFSLKWPVVMQSGVLVKREEQNEGEELSCSLTIQNIQPREILYTEWQLKCFDILKKPILTEIPVLIRHEALLRPRKIVTVNSLNLLPPGTRSFIPYLKAVLYADQTIEEFAGDEQLLMVEPRIDITSMEGYNLSALNQYKQKTNLSEVPQYLYEKHDGIWTCAFCGTRNKEGIAECQLCLQPLEKQELCSRVPIEQIFIEYTALLKQLEEKKRKQREEEHRLQVEEERKRLEEQEKKAKEEREREALAKKRRSADLKIFVLTLFIIIVVSVAGLILWNYVFENMYVYNKAQKAMQASESYKAYELYASLGDYQDAREQSLEAYREFVELHSSALNQVDAYQWLLDNGYNQEKVFGSFSQLLELEQAEERALTGWRWLDGQGYAEAKAGIYRIAKGMVEIGRYSEAYELYTSLGDYQDAREQSLDAYREFVELDSSALSQIEGYQWLLDNGYNQEKVFESQVKMLSVTESEEARIAGWRWLDSKGYGEAKAGLYEIAENMVENERYYEAYELYTSLGDYQDAREQSLDAYREFVELDSSALSQIEGYQWLLDNGYNQEKVFGSFSQLLELEQAEERALTGWRWLDGQGYAEAKAGIYRIAKGMVEIGRYSEAYELYTSLGDYNDAHKKAVALTVKVNFNSVGGSAVSAHTNVLMGTKISNPIAPTRAGYVFDGWYKESGCVNIWDFGVDVVTADVMLYARWYKMYAVGSTGPAGGLIFYDKGHLSDGWRYLEVAHVSYESSRIVWGGYQTTVGSFGTAIGTGKSNTEKIILKFGNTEPYKKKADYAAKVCADLVVTKDGVVYDDWFLPSKDELGLMYLNLRKQDLGDFSDNDFWSSSEHDGYNAWNQHFGSGRQYYDNRSYVARVRPVRAF